jgi:hypothetical protein
MPDAHLPHLDDDTEPAASAQPKRMWKSLLKVGLEIVLITTGVFLGLAGEQWRESVRHRDLAHASLERFREEFRRNRAEVLRVHERHVVEERDMSAYLRAHDGELSAHAGDPRTPIPGPVPDMVTDHAGFDYSAWEVAVATQSLAYVQPDLVAVMSAAYRLQEVYDDSHRAIAQTSYSAVNEVQYLRGVTTWFGDVVLYEELLLKRYETILARLDSELAAGK